MIRKLNVLVVVLFLSLFVSESYSVAWWENWDTVTGSYPTVQSVRPEWTTIAGKYPVYVRTDAFAGYNFSTSNGICGQNGFNWYGISRATGASATDVNVVAMGTIKFIGNSEDNAVLYLGATANNEYGASGLSIALLGNNNSFELKYIRADGTINYSNGYLTGINPVEDANWNQYRWVLSSSQGSQTATAQVRVAGTQNWTTLGSVQTDSTFKSDYFSVALYYAAIGDDFSFNCASNSQSFYWNTGIRDDSGVPAGKLLSDNTSYWGDTILTGVTRTETVYPTNRDIVFDFKRPCTFTEVVLFTNSTVSQPLTIRVRPDNQSYTTVYNGSLSAGPQNRLKVHRIALSNASGRYMKITAPASTTVLDSSNIWIWGNGEISDTYPEYLNSVYSLTPPPAGSFESIRGISTTQFTTEQFNQWRSAIGSFYNSLPFVWSKQPTFGNITNKPLLPTAAEIKSALNIEMTRDEQESVSFALTNTSISNSQNLTLSLSDFRKAGSNQIAPGITGKLYVIGAVADIYHTALYPLFSADNKLSKGMMQKYVTNGEYIADFPDITLPQGGSAVIWLTIETKDAQPGIYEADLSAGIGQVFKIKAFVYNITMPAPYVWIFGWQFGTGGFTMQPFTYSDTPARDAGYSSKILTAGWGNVPSKGTYYLPVCGTEDYRNFMEDQGFTELLRLNPNFSIGTWPWRGTPSVVTEAEKQLVRDGVNQLVANAAAMGISYNNWFIAGPDEPGVGSKDGLKPWLELIKQTDSNVRNYLNPSFYNGTWFEPSNTVYNELYPWYNSFVDISVPYEYLLSYAQCLSALWQSQRAVNAFYDIQYADASYENVESTFRSMSWISYKKNLNGWAFYGYNATGQKWGDELKFNAVFPGPKGIIPTRASESLREAWQDYRLLTMLKERGFNTQLASILTRQGQGVSYEILRSEMLQLCADQSLCYTAIFNGNHIESDLNFDCYVDIADLAALAENWGYCIEPTDLRCE